MTRWSIDESMKTIKVCWSAIEDFLWVFYRSTVSIGLVMWCPRLWDNTYKGFGLHDPQVCTLMRESICLSVPYQSVKVLMI